MPESIVVPGKFDIFCALPSTAHATLLKLGVNVDDLECPLEVIKAPVYGDAHGGRAGDPIEDQYLGERSRTSLELTVYDKVVAAFLRAHGGILTTPGNIPETAIGALMRRDHCFRFCFIPVRDATLAVNFPCVTITRNTLIAGGTKHAALRLELEMHRSPIGHIGNKDNILYDADVTGVPSPG